MRHPLALYFANADKPIYPDIYKRDERYKLISQNPVACACFFDYMVKLFIKHILGMDTDHNGLFGKTKGFYGTVEEQGRLTLHLHLLLWIENSLTPQEIRQRLLDKDGVFQQSLIAYLESVHQGSYFNTLAEDNLKDIGPIDNKFEADDGTLFVRPIPPPKQCKLHKSEPNLICNTCQKTETWHEAMKDSVDEIVWRVNKHKHHDG